MPKFNWTVEYLSTPDGGSVRSITDVQNISIQMGLTNITDVWQPARLTITGRNPAQFDGYPMDIGNAISADISSTSGSPTVTALPIFQGQISDIAYYYDYVTNGDTFTIQAEGVLARIGRKTGDATWTAGQNIEQAIDAFSSGIATTAYTLSSTVSAQTITDGQAGSYLSKLLQMEQGSCGDVLAGVWLYGRNYTAYSSVTFTDGTTAAAAGGMKYTHLEFGSRAQNYATQVIVQPDGLAAQTDGTGDRVYNIATYDETTTQALGLAQYVNASLVAQQGLPLRITTTDDIQSTNNLRYGSTAQSPWAYCYIGFRNTFYETLIIGAVITANPDRTTFTYNLAPKVAREFLILDDVSWGKLDDAKLGF